MAGRSTPPHLAPWEEGPRQSPRPDQRKNGRPRPPSARKGAAPPEEENAWTPSARPADFSLESPGGREKDGNKISRPRPGWTTRTGNKAISESWQEGSASAHDTIQAQAPTGKPGPFRRSAGTENRQAGRRRTCRPSPSPIYMAKRPTVTTSRTTWTTGNAPRITSEPPAIIPARSSQKKRRPC